MVISKKCAIGALLSDYSPVELDMRSDLVAIVHITRRVVWLGRELGCKNSAVADTFHG